MPPIPAPSNNPPSAQGRLAASDGVELAWYRWDPARPARGTIVLHHGLGEHAGRYAHVARAFTQDGWTFLGFDARGHGRSEGRRGHSPSLRQMRDDLDLILKRAPSPPVIAYGHSLGGLVVLTYVLSGGSGVQATIVTAPWLRLSFPAPATKVMVARSLVRILPAMTMATGLEQAAVSRDPAVVAAYAADPLVHDRLSFRLGVDLLDGGERALDRAGDFRLPVLLMHGGADRLTDPKASQLFYERAASADKTFRLWPGAYHEIHNDLEWEQVLEVATDWARPRAA